MATRTDNQILIEEGYYFLSKQDDEWIPYRGPDGGEGWQRVGDDEVRYQQRPPGETASGVEDTYWSDTLGADALTEFLEERVSSETMGRIGARVQEAEEQMDSDRDTEAGYLWGRLQHRENKWNQDLSEAPEDKLINLVDSIFESREKEFARRERMDELAELIEDTHGIGHRERVNVARIVDSVQEDTDLSEEAIRDELLDSVRDSTHHPSEALEESVLESWADELVEQWREENLTAESEIEIPEGFDQSDIESEDVYNAITATSIAPFDLPRIEIAEGDKDPLAAVWETMEEKFGDDPNEMYYEIQAFNEALKDTLKPFHDTHISAPDHLNPKNADEVGELDKYVDKTGRSASSMFVAKGVPDENGDKRDLYITNTNRDREGVRAQKDEDAERQVLGTEGFRAAGFDAPESYHESGEFWVVEGVEGDTADEYHVEDDLETPVEQFAELGATAAVLGAWDIHEGNVFIHDGEFIPVDMDLAGAELAHNADHSRNRYHADLQGMMGLFPRIRRLFDCMDGGDSIEFSEIENAVKRRVAEMGESDEARKIAEAAQINISNHDLKTNIASNVQAIEQDDFFEEYPTESIADDTDFDIDSIDELEEGQVIEVADEDRGEIHTQEFQIVDNDATPGGRLEIEATSDGEMLAEGERTFVSSLKPITDIIDTSDEENWEVHDPVGYDDIYDFEEGQLIEVTGQGGPIKARIREIDNGWLGLETLDGKYTWGERHVDDVTGILEPPSPDDGEDTNTPTEDDVIASLEDELDERLAGNPDTDADSTDDLDEQAEEEMNSILDEIVEEFDEETMESVASTSETAESETDDTDDAANDWEIVGPGYESDGSNPDDIEEVFSEISDIVSEIREEDND